MTPEIHKDWSARVKQHAEADRFIKGEWLNDMVGEFRSGCFFGCMTQTKDNTIELASKQMQSPEWLIRLAEHLFEQLPEGQYESFPSDYMAAIPKSINEDQYTALYYRTSALRMKRVLEVVNNIETDLDYKRECQDAIKQVLSLHDCQESAESAESAAESAAWSAARSAAESAAWSAAWSAWPARSARSAAESAARSARSAAESAAWSAWSAWPARSARSAAESAAWSAASAIQERDDLFLAFSELNK